jgi:diguanylate cyclase (GGDEF)-like protein
MNERLAELAVTDGLTGIKNHRHFRDSLEVAMSLAMRQSIPLSVIMLDIDHFKMINDAHGHAAGDDVLRTVARILGENTREHDEVARYGGEEFAILLPLTDADAALALAERLRESIAGHPWPLRSVTASLGVATFPGAHISRATTLLEEADLALYHSKKRGRNCVSHHDEPMHISSHCTSFADGEDLGKTVVIHG